MANVFGLTLHLPESRHATCVSASQEAADMESLEEWRERIESEIKKYQDDVKAGAERIVRLVGNYAGYVRRLGEPDEQEVSRYGQREWDDGNAGRG